MHATHAALAHLLVRISLKRQTIIFLKHAMKKILFTALVAFAIASCSDDDNNSNSSNTTLAGKWKLSSIIVPVAVDLDGDGKKGNDLVKESGCLDESDITFPTDTTKQAVVRLQELEIGKDAAGKSTVECSAPATTNSAYTVTGDNVKLTYDGEQVTFKKTGKTLSATQDGATITFTKQ